ncbi:hypothetical protein RLOC_00012519 [Lonchura striata]|uniref:Secreted protein n=1 Tax=Lonchura striata TaxID=40157 RepID=A0A218V8I3_9PASE|nr:hypothetical protein RLOC_00012519 [Lonchura striata domestica]
MAFCFLFLPAIYTHTSLLHLVCLEAAQVPCGSLCPFSLPGAGEEARGRFVALKLRNTQWKNGKCCWLEWSSINRNPGPSLRLLCLGFFEIKGEHGI